ncbi:unnamed protein product [Effrenium voratum]|nr:unnamed protein product [Effrenium voratum]
MMRCLLQLVLPFAGVYAGPALSEWEKQLFARTAANAKEQSDAAEPELLALLGSADFRQHLSECCQSVAHLTSEELLDIIERQSEVVEVVSGFPPTVDPESMFPDASAMSVDFGINSSYFLNDWEVILLHSSDPQGVFHNVTVQYSDAACDQQREEVELGTWPTGCNGQRYVQKFPLNQCYEDAEHPGLVLSYRCKGTTLTQLGWSADMSRRSAWKLARGSEQRPVPCPSGMPVQEVNQTADGKCHSNVLQNNTDGFLEQDLAELREYGLKPFQQPAAPANISEAVERPIYCVVNDKLVDVGSAIYGDISAVFSNEYIWDSTLLAPADTGLYTSECIRKEKTVWAPPVNCSAYNETLKQLGTLKHHKHLLLLNKGFWGPLAAIQSIFPRLEEPWGSHNVPNGTWLGYMEAALIGRQDFPASVKFLIACYPVLFGTPHGERVQLWARSRGWVLIWALGPNSRATVSGVSTDTGGFNMNLLKSSRSFAANQRILDPYVLGNTTAVGSMPVQPEDLLKFQQKWSEVTALRKTAKLSNATMAEQWAQTAQLLPQLRMRPMRGEDCKPQRQAGECVGVSLQGQRAEETNELSMEMKKVRLNMQEYANSSQQRIQDEISHLTNEILSIRDSLASELQALRDVQASDAAKLREALDTSGWKLRDQQTAEVGKLREAFQLELKNLRDEVSRASREARGFEAQAASSLRTEVAQLRGELDQQRSEAKLRSDELRRIGSDRLLEREEELRTELKSLRAGLTSQGADLSAVQRELTDLSALQELSAHQTDVHGLRGDLDLCKSDLATCRAEVSSSSSLLAQVKSELGSVQSESSSWRQALEDQRCECGALRSELTTQRSDLESQKSQLAACESDVSQLSFQVPALKEEQSAQLRELSLDVTQVRKEHSDLRKELLEAREQIGGVGKEAASTQSRVQALEKDSSSLQGRMVTLQKGLERRGEEASEAQRRLAELRQDLQKEQGQGSKLQKELAEVQSHHGDARKEFLELQGHLSDLRREVARKDSAALDFRQEMEKTRAAENELRKDLTLAYQLEAANLRKELLQKEEGLNGEFAAAQARVKEQIANEVRRLMNEVHSIAQRGHQTEQQLKDEVLRLGKGLRKTEEEASELRKEVHEACSAIEDQRREVDAHLSLRISEVQQTLQSEFKVADANLHAEVATSAANDRYNLGVEMERLRADLGQVDLLRTSVAQAQELASRLGSHEVIATLRVDQFSSHLSLPCDYEFPLVASRCVIRLKPNRKGDLSPQSPGLNGEFWPEYVGVFFGLCETRVTLGNAANRLSSYVCAVRVDMFDPQTSSWLTVLENPAQELVAGGALLGSHEALTMGRFKELVSASYGQERKVMLRVVVSDIGFLRLQQFEDTFPTPYAN